MKQHTTRITTPHRGFTLIELLVVIAIIGILASVVLASLSTSRDKGADAKVKAELASARTQAQTYYDTMGTYYTTDTDNVCTSATGVYDLLASAAATVASTVVINGSQVATGNANCNVYTDGWVVQVPLKVLNQLSSTSGTDYWCVDSAGKSKLQDQPLADFVLDEEVDPAIATPISCL
jgi:prepilin-type N-terminal cleavage/methylation domain-containing protein